MLLLFILRPETCCRDVLQIYIFTIKRTYIHKLFIFKLDENVDVRRALK